MTAKYKPISARVPPLDREDVSPRSSTSSILENINGFDRSPSEFPDNEKTVVDVDSRAVVRRWSRKHFMRIASFIMIVLVVTISIVTLSHHRNNSVAHKKIVSLNDMRSGRFRAIHKEYNWLDLNSENNTDSGDYLVLDQQTYYKANLNDPDHKVELSANRVTISGRKRTIVSFELNKEGTRALVSTEREKNWRHSAHSHYWILDLESNTYSPVHTPDENAQISLALWSPRGDRVSYVLDNNLYIRKVADRGQGESVTITHDGGEDVMYGVPDWVYEEEVFGTGNAMWWSNNGDYLAFSKFNDTEVPTFTIPYMVQDGNDAKGSSYPVMKDIKYPKPGYSNPIVELMFLRVKDYEVFQIPIETSQSDDIISEIVWTHDSRALVRFTNRESDLLRVSVVNADTQTSQIVRSLNFKDIDGGWFEVVQTTIFVPMDLEMGRQEDGYIDTVIIDGYNHLAYFSPIESAEPKIVLTQGKWEVDGQVNFDPNTNTVYYLSTETSPMERHLYSVDLLQGASSKSAITNISEEGYYSTSFSTRSRYLVLSYLGPDVPWQKVVDLYEENALENAETIVDNVKLKTTLSNYELPSVRYSQLEVDTDHNGDPILVNVKEILPPGFYEHDSHKYPVLFAPYGGPASQQTGKTYSIQFEHTLAAEHNVIVVILDGRGTGFMGRNFRCSVRDNLGQLEAYDQIQGAKAYAEKSYVDEQNIAIWGWSYGGYLTLKTLEQDAGETFSYGMAVAPVTNWRLYDSIYTERYMHTPQNNPTGYDYAAVVNVTAISQNERFLIMHGTGDDNVHFQNSLVLLDKLDEKNIENYDVHVFPDSDHSISYHNANKIVYDKLRDWIVLAFDNKFKELD